jgi:hypothetical protein
MIFYGKKWVSYTQKLQKYYADRLPVISGTNFKEQSYQIVQFYHILSTILPGFIVLPNAFVFIIYEKWRE